MTSLAETQNKCPPGQYPEYTDPRGKVRCQPCGVLCSQEMTDIEAVNCQLLCPDSFEALESATTTVADLTTAGDTTNQVVWYVTGITLASVALLVVTALTLAAILYKCWYRRRKHDKEDAENNRRANWGEEEHLMETFHPPPISLPSVPSNNLEIPISSISAGSGMGH